MAPFGEARKHPPFEPDVPVDQLVVAQGGCLESHYRCIAFRVSVQDTCNQREYTWADGYRLSALLTSCAFDVY